MKRTTKEKLIGHAALAVTLGVVGGFAGCSAASQADVASENISKEARRSSGC